MYEIADLKFIVDLGISFKQLKEKLINLAVDLEKIDFVLIGHEHIDHYKGLKTFTKNTSIPIYITNGTINAIMKKEQIITENIQIIKAQQFLQVQDLKIEILQTSHDASEPVSYIFHSNGEKYLHLTDTGYITDEIQKQATNLEVYVIESNYEDEVILQNTKYPFMIKKRIIGEKGHLSNIQCNQFLDTVVGSKTKLVCFAHLSENNNTKELVEMENKDINVEKVVLDKEKIVSVDYGC